MSLHTRACESLTAVRLHGYRAAMPLRPNLLWGNPCSKRAFVWDTLWAGFFIVSVGVYGHVWPLAVVLAAVQYMWCPMHRWAEVRRQGAEATALPRETARRWQVVGLAATIGGAAIGASVAAVLAYPPGASGGPVFVVAVAGGMIVGAVAGFMCATLFVFRRNVR